MMENKKGRDQGRETVGVLSMNCIACGKPTIIAYRISDIEAAFCPEHVPRREKKIRIEVRCM